MVGSTQRDPRVVVGEGSHSVAQTYGFVGKNIVGKIGRLLKLNKVV